MLCQHLNLYACPQNALHRHALRVYYMYLRMHSIFLNVQSIYLRMHSADMQCVQTSLEYRAHLVYSITPYLYKCFSAKDPKVVPDLHKETCKARHPIGLHHSAESRELF